MKNAFAIFTAMTVLVCGPTFAKEVSEFPSRSIRPVISNAEADRAYGHTAPQHNETPRLERVTPPTPRYCTRPYNAREESNTHDRRDCLPENTPLTQSDIPQLRAFRQPSTQRFAP